MGFSSCGEWGLSSSCGRVGFSCGGSRAQSTGPGVVAQRLSHLLTWQGLVPVTAAGLLLPLGEGPVWGDSRGPAAAFSVRVWAFVPGSNLEKL